LLAHLAEKIPGFSLRDFIQSPESSEITGRLVNLEKYFTFNLALAKNVFPVSFGLLILSILGEIFLILLDSKKLISLNFPSLCVPINIFFINT
jgi:hypothetical protein